MVYFISDFFSFLEIKKKKKKKIYVINFGQVQDFFSSLFKE